MKIKLKVTPHGNNRVCIIGNLNIDLIIRNVSRLPVWGQEVFGDNYFLTSSGQSAYSAFTLSRYDIPTSIIGNVGNDIYGNMILEDLKKGGVEISAVEQVEDGSTGITVALVRNDGERAFVSDPSSLESFNRDNVLRHFKIASSASLVAIVGNFMLPGFSFSDTGFFCEKFRKSGISTILDTGWDPNNWSGRTVRELRSILKHIDYFIPNMDEAEALTGEKTPEKAGKKLLSDGCGKVIIKLGAEGSCLCSGKEEYIVPAFKTEVFDAVGAGDVFNAGFIFGLLQSWPLEACIIFGSASSSLYISRNTDRFPGLKESIIRANRNEKYEFKELQAYGY